MVRKNNPSKRNKAMDISINKELSRIFPSSADVKGQLPSLTSDILEHGIRSSIVIWKETGYIIDGVKRWGIAKRHNLPVKTVMVSLPDMKAAKELRLRIQLQRRNLNKFERALAVITAAEERFVKQAKANQKRSRGRGKLGPNESNGKSESIDVNKRLAQLAGVSREFLCHTRYLLKHKDPEIMQELGDGKISVHRAYNWKRKKQKKKARDEKDKVKFKYVNDLSKGIDNQVICADVIDGLRKIPSKAATLVFTSPPFNVGKNYADGISDDKPWDEYLDWLKQVFKEIKRTLRPGGRCVVEIAETRTTNKDDQAIEYNRPISSYFISLMQKLGYLYRTTIIWDKGNLGGPFTAWGSTCCPSSPCVRYMHSYIFVFSVDKWDLPCTGDSSFLSKADFDTLTRSIWRQTPEHHGKGTHVAPMPVALADNVIKLYSYKGDLVCDPFGGSATTAVSALRNGRRFVSIDASPTYCAQANKRIAAEMKKLGIKPEKRNAA